MTIQDTIPKWSGEESKWLHKKRIKRDGKTIVCIDRYYEMFSSQSPYPFDRYYFRIKLKQKP
jgi:hypothetical protein